MKNIINILDYICTGEDVLKGVDAMRMEYIFIKPADEYLMSKDMFRNFLSSNMRVTFKIDNALNEEILMFDNKELDYRLECLEAEQSNELFFHFVVEIKEDEEKDVGVLEDFDKLIKIK